MKFCYLAVSVIAILCAIFAAVIMAYQGLYFRCFLLMLFVSIQVDTLAIRMKLERD